MDPQVSAFRVVFVAKYSYIPDGLNLQLADIYFEILTMKSEVKKSLIMTHFNDCSFPIVSSDQIFLLFAHPTSTHLCGVCLDQV